MFPESELSRLQQATRSRPTTTPRKRKKPLRRPDAPLPALLNDSQVLRLHEWAQLAGISMRTARRILGRGDGPKTVQLSDRRVGVAVGAHRQWLASRERG